MEVRKALPEEAKYLSDLAFRSKSYWPYDEAALNRYRPNLEVHAEDILSGSTYVGVVEKEIVGFYVLSSVPNIQRLYFLFVEPEFIGLGYGKKLWEHALFTAKCRQWKTISFFADRFAVKKFYDGLGGKQIGEMENDLGSLTELQFEIP